MLAVEQNLGDFLGVTATGTVALVAGLVFLCDFRQLRTRYVAHVWRSYQRPIWRWANIYRSERNLLWAARLVAGFWVAIGIVCVVAEIVTLASGSVR